MRTHVQVLLKIICLFCIETQGSVRGHSAPYGQLPPCGPRGKYTLQSRQQTKYCSSSDKVSHDIKCEMESLRVCM